MELRNAGVADALAARTLSSTKVRSVELRNARPFAAPMQGFSILNEGAKRGASQFGVEVVAVAYLDSSTKVRSVELRNALVPFGDGEVKISSTKVRSVELRNWYTVNSLTKKLTSSTKVRSVELRNPPPRPIRRILGALLNEGAKRGASQYRAARPNGSGFPRFLNEGAKRGASQL